MPGYGFGFGFGGLWGILLWGLFIAGIVWLVIWLNRPRPRQNSALELLKQRYARGEISREEYLRMRDDIDS